MMRASLRYGLVLGLGTVLAVACEESVTVDGGPQPPPDYPYVLEDAFPGVKFVRPVDIQSAGDGSGRVFVVEQTGRIHWIKPGETTATPFLDISSQVTYLNESETGLLGLAFHPQYGSNGYFFVYYTTTTTVLMARLSRFSVSADPDVADTASEVILLEFPERQPNHNGGGLCFDGSGYLCVAVGDEGGAGDPYDNAQDRTTLYGSILRIDVDQNAGAPPYYGIPPDNPFAGNSSGYREEIFAFGFRNPWRVSYDATDDRLWAGDVGQNAWEEIDVVVSGGNYGWDCREGNHRYTGPGSPSPACGAMPQLMGPVFEYPHSVGESITGGYVYRGASLDSLAGRYVYADYITGKIWALARKASTSQLLMDTDHFISTFGVDEAGELLVAGYFAGGTPASLYRLRRAEVSP